MIHICPNMIPKMNWVIWLNNLVFTPRLKNMKFRMMRMYTSMKVIRNFKMSTTHCLRIMENILKLLRVQSRRWRKLKKNTNPLLHNLKMPNVKLKSWKRSCWMPTQRSSFSNLKWFKLMSKWSASQPRSLIVYFHLKSLPWTKPDWATPMKEVWVVNQEGRWSL